MIQNRVEYILNKWQFVCGFSMCRSSILAKEFHFGIVNVSHFQEYTVLDSKPDIYRGFVFNILILYGDASFLTVNFITRTNKFSLYIPAIRFFKGL